MDYQTICRVCTGTNSTMLSIFESYNFSAQNCEIFKVITDCASVQIQKFDGFPEQICCRCLHDLSQAYSFRKMCEHSDSKFRSLKSKASCEIEIKSEQCNDEFTTDDNSDRHKDEIEEAASLFSGGFEIMECEGPSVIEDAQCTEKDNSGLPYKCEQCGVSFATKRCLSLHMKIHAGQESTKSDDEFGKGSIADDEILIKSEFFEEDAMIHFSNIHAETEDNTDRKRKLSDSEVIDIKEDSESDFENESGAGQATSTSETTIPERSKTKYTIVYQKFMDWRSKNNARSFSEDVLMAYFTQISNEFKPSSLWAIYSMLKSMIKIKNNVHTGNYFKLKAHLKGLSNGYKGKKSMTFTAGEILKFIREAPALHYLFLKAVLIIGISGRCRIPELKKLKISDVDDTGKILVFKILDTRTKKHRSFIVSGTFYEICKEYMNIRRQITDSNVTQFFLQYKEGKCGRQVVGVNKLGSVPKLIAEYLQLPNPTDYTGHCFKKTTCTVLVDAGGDLMAL